MSNVSEREGGEETLVNDRSTDLDQEREVQRLRRIRSVAKGILTKKIKQLTEWKMRCESFGDANLKCEEFKNTVEDFYCAHESYHSTISDDYEIMDSQEYFETEKKRIDNFLRTLEEWLHTFESQQIRLPQESEVRPNDSVSNVQARSRVNSSGSKVSKNSSTLSARLAIRARKAALEAERSELEAQQALEKERLQIEQRARELKLRTEHTKIEAEEKIYTQAMGGDLEDLHANYEKRFQPRVNLPAPNVPKQTFPEVKDDDQTSSYVAEEFLRSMSNMQQQQQQQIMLMFEMQQKRDDQLHHVLTCHRDMAASMSLPDVNVPIFDGKATEYCHFVRAFENLIESKTLNERTKLFCLVQYTSGEVKDLMRSCLIMKPEEGYTEARRLLKEKYGQSYRIATAYVDRVTEATPIKSEDGTALQTFSVLLISCRNTLKEIGYLNKIENPDCLIKIIEKQSFSLRQKWRERADDITNNKEREINFDDIVELMISQTIKKER